MKWILAGVMLLVGACALEEPGKGGRELKREAKASPDPSQLDYEPKGRYEGNCDILLSSGIYGTDYFIAEGRVRNVGDVDFEAKVFAKWELAGGGAVKDNKMVQIDSGKSKRVSFKVAAKETEIDAFQSHPGYYESKNCKYFAVITE